MWHPLRSPRVMWHATWAGENDPAKAIALAEPAVQDDDSESAAEGDDSPPPPPPDDGKGDEETPPPDPPNGSQKMTPAIAKAAAAIKRHPKLTDAEVAKKAGVSERTVQRSRSVVATGDRRTAP